MSEILGQESKENNSQNNAYELSLDSSNIHQLENQKTREEYETIIQNTKAELSQLEQELDDLILDGGEQSKIEEVHTELNNKYKTLGKLLYESIWEPSIEDILKRPKDIRFIKSEEKLILLFESYPEELSEEISIKDIPPHFLQSPDVLKSYPGYFTSAEDIQLLPSAALKNKDIILPIIQNNIRRGTTPFIHDILLAYKAAGGEQTDEFIREMLTSGEDLSDIISQIPHSILNEKLAQELGIPYEKKEFQDESYYREKAQKLSSFPIPGNLLYETMEALIEIDTYLEQKQASAEIIQILCEKGIISEAAFAKQQIRNNPKLGKIIIESPNPANIRYLSYETRGEKSFQEALFSSGKISKWTDLRKIDDYISLKSDDDVQSIKSCLRWWNFLTKLDGRPREKEIISIYPDIISTIGSSNPFDRDVINLQNFDSEDMKVLQNLLNQTFEYASIDELKNPLTEIKKQENLDQKIDSLVANYDAKNQEALKKLLESSDTTHITSQAYELVEILGSEKKALDFLKKGLAIIKQKNEYTIKRLAGAPIRENDYPDSFQKYLIDNPEIPGSYTIDKAKLKILSAIIFRANSKAILAAPKEERHLLIKQFFRKYLTSSHSDLSQDQQKKILEILVASNNLEHIQALQDDDGNIRSAVLEDDFDVWEETSEHISQKYKHYGLDENGKIRQEPVQQKSNESFSESFTYNNSDKIVSYGSETLLITGEENIPISEQDHKAIQNNPEAEKNLIDFYKTLKNLNLEEFWNYKDKIFNVIQTKSTNSGININDKNYISKQELSLFLYTVADAVSEYLPPKEQIEIASYSGNKQDFSKTYQLLLRLNKQDSILREEDKSLLRDESRIGQIFRREFLGRSSDKDDQSIMGLNIGKLQNSLDT